MRPLYGDAADIQARAERAEALARQSNQPESELTVEQCLKELREVFPADYWIRIDQSAFDEPAMNKGIVKRVTISIDKLADDFEAETLSGAMNLFRAWKESQQQERK